ncbi:MAG: hypothetical protein WBE26_20240 [Phycisphaerae bacterium]
MFARLAVIAGFFGVASAAHAGAVVELVPDDPGPYYGGESLTVDVWLNSAVSFDAPLIRVQFDFSDTSTGLLLDPTFVFDFSSLESDINAYGVYPELPVPWTWNPLECVCPELFLHLGPDEPLHIGSVGVKLPTHPGLYVLDALNANDPDILHGAQIVTTVPGAWTAFDGDITGKPFGFVIVPEPGMLSLIVLGTLVVMCKRHHRPRSPRQFLQMVIYAVCVCFLTGARSMAEPAPIPSEPVEVNVASGGEHVPSTVGGLMATRSLTGYPT